MSANRSASRFTLQAIPRWIDPLLIAGAVALLYFQVHNHGFVELDDPSYVLGNPRVLGGLNWSSFAWAWTTFELSNYHPLTWLSYLLDVQVFGPQPGVMALENAFFHAVNGCLVLRLFAALGCSRWGALLGALVFVVHPLNVESVAWISERKTTLAALFGLIAILDYLRRAHAGRPPVGWFGVLSFALSLLCKPWFVVLPGVLLVLDYWPLSRLREPISTTPETTGWKLLVRWGPRLIWEKGLLVILSLGISVLAIASQHAGGSLRTITAMPPGLRLGNAIISTCNYLTDLFCLGANGLFYPMPASIPLAHALLTAAILAGISTAVVAYARRYPEFVAGWLWYLLFLLPVIGLVQVGWQARADRYMYLPMIGLLWILITLGERSIQLTRPTLKPLLPVAAISCLVIAGLSAHRQIGFWRNTFGIAGRTIALVGPTPRMVGMLGTAHLRAGRWSEALPLLDRSFRDDSRDHSVAINLAIALFLNGRQTEAVDQAKQILQQDPGYYPARNHLAHFYRDMGQIELALEQEEQMRRQKAGRGSHPTQTPLP